LTIDYFATKGTEMIFEGINPDNPDISNNKHQITISKSQISSNANCLEFLIAKNLNTETFIFLQYGVR